MKVFATSLVIVMLTIAVSQPSLARNATAASKMSGTDAVFGSTGKCHAGWCPARKAASIHHGRHAVASHTRHSSFHGAS